MKLIKFFALILVLSLSSCSTKVSKVAPDEYLKLNNLHSSKHRACIQHKSQILDKPITVAEEAELNDELYFFVRDEQKALTYIDHFDISKFTLKENQLEYESVINACVLKRDHKHTTCDTLFPSYKFFRGLIYGMNQYKWSAPTKIKARDLTLQYLQYVGQSESSLMDVTFANDLLMRLSERGHVKRELYPETIQFKNQAEDEFKGLKKKIRKLGKKEFTCKDAEEFYANERIKVKELSQSFLVILSKAR